MVGSDEESQDPNGGHGVDHAQVAEGFLLTRVVGDYVGDYAESGENKDINFRVTKESKQVLVQYGVPPSGRIEEGGV